MFIGAGIKEILQNDNHKMLIGIAFWIIVFLIIIQW